MIIYQHLGLGDMIICNGLVRNIVARNPGINIIFANPEALESVRFMYRDLKNLHVIEGDYPQINDFLQSTQAIYICIGDRGYGLVKKGFLFDHWFYHQHQIPFEKRWADFHIERDHSSEDKLMDMLLRDCLAGGKYIFMHDDNRFKIDAALLNPDLPVIRVNPAYTRNIFNYCKLIEEAAEVHVIESSFLFLTDSLRPKGKLFSHRYARQYPPDNAPTLKLKWDILT